MPKAASTAKPERTTEEAGAALVEQWRSSGLSMLEFAARRGLPAHRVSYWKRRLETPAKTAAKTAKQTAAKTAREGFLLVRSEARPQSGERSDDAVVEVVVDERVKIRVPMRVSELGILLRAIKEANR